MRPGPAGLAALQRHAGNAAVTRLLSGRSGPSVQRAPDPVTVQRVPLTSPCLAPDPDLQDSATTKPG